MAGFLIWSGCAVVFLILGLRWRKSIKPVTIWANAKPPEVTDVKKFNTAVSNLWLVFSVLYEVLGIPLLFAKQNSALILLTIPTVMFLIIGLMAVYMKIENRYRKKT